LYLQFVPRKRRAVWRFNELLHASAELEAVILPMHDGLAVAVKL